MTALLLCAIGFILGFVLGRKSLWAGILVVVASGYFYGILRANLSPPFSHFIFDAALVGLYGAQFLAQKKQPQTSKNSSLNLWMAVLIGWPLLMVLMPFQPFLVSLVGLRGNMFFLPAVFLGTRLRDFDLRRIAVGLSILNLISLAFGVAETFKGIEPFFPYSPLTVTMYNSLDSSGANRIPSIFQNAHTYAGVMVFTLPILFGAWSTSTGVRWRKPLYVLGMAAALVGVLMAATRQNILAAGMLVVIASISGKLGTLKRFVWVAAIAAVIWAAMHNDRWQRYKELDSQSVEERISGSVNRTFWEILEEYPMGNGLGGGGTSVPYFLASEVRNPIWVESEYCRIILEQGVIGFLLWIGFIGWFITNRSGFVKDEWLTGRRMAWYLCLFSFLTGAIGVGLLSAIPNTFLFLLCIGWTSVAPASEAARVASPAAPALPLQVPLGARIRSQIS